MMPVYLVKNFIDNNDNKKFIVLHSFNSYREEDEASNIFTVGIFDTFVEAYVAAINNADLANYPIVSDLESSNDIGVCFKVIINNDESEDPDYDPDYGYYYILENERS